MENELFMSDPTFVLQAFMRSGQSGGNRNVSLVDWEFGRMAVCLEALSVVRVLGERTGPSSDGGILADQMVVSALEQLVENTVGLIRANAVYDKLVVWNRTGFVRAGDEEGGASGLALVVDRDPGDEGVEEIGLGVRFLDVYPSALASDDEDLPGA